MPRTQQPFIADKNYVSSNQIIGTVTSTVLPTEEELAQIYAAEQDEIARQALAQQALNQQYFNSTPPSEENYLGESANYNAEF